jgi:hypothetical protein
LLQSEKLARQKLLKQQNLNRVKVKSLSQRMVKRTVRTTTRNLAQIPAESIPYVGAAVIVAATALDIKDACDTLHDLDEIMALAGVEKQQSSTTMNTLCDPKMLDLAALENSKSQSHDQDIKKAIDASVAATQAHYRHLQQELIRHVAQAERQFRDEWGGMLQGLGMKLIELSNDEPFQIEDC